MKYSKSIKDMTDHLNTQIKFLKNSIILYDSGIEDEAQRIATTIRVLLHDTNNSTSLFKHLKIKENMLFLSTVPGYIPGNLLSYQGLLCTSSTGFYIPICLADNKIQGLLLTFTDWWNEIVLDDKINSFTRKDIVLNVANTDGGAHVDDKLNEAYANLSRNNSLSGCMSSDRKEPILYNSPVYACIRQIAFELLYSIDFSDNIKSYTRKKDDSMIFKAAYIKDNLYLISSEYLNNPVFEDLRVTKTKERKNYIDEVTFVSGKTCKSYVILK